MTARITVRPTHSMTQFILKAVTPEVSVNGQSKPLAWKSVTSIEVEPGSHDVEVYFPYLGRKSGAARTSITVNEGETVSLDYRAPLVVTASGKLTRG